MSSIRTLYNDELVAAQRSAVAVLHQLMHETDDPLERRRIAIALLRSRLADDGAPPPPRSRSEAAPRFHKEQTSSPPPHSATTPADAASAANSTGAEEPQAPLAASTPSAPITAESPPQPPPTPFSPDAGAPGRDISPAPPGFRDCTHPALPPYPGMHIRELMKKARQT